MATVSTSARLREVIQREMGNPASPVAGVRSGSGRSGNGKSGAGKSGNGKPGNGRGKLAPAGRLRT